MIGIDEPDAIALVLEHPRERERAPAAVLALFHDDGARNDGQVSATQTEASDVFSPRTKQLNNKMAEILAGAVPWLKPLLGVGRCWRRGRRRRHGWDGHRLHGHGRQYEQFRGHRRVQLGSQRWWNDGSMPSTNPSASPSMDGSRFTTERSCVAAGGTWSSSMSRCTIAR